MIYTPHCVCIHTVCTVVECKFTFLCPACTCVCVFMLHVCMSVCVSVCVSVGVNAVCVSVGVWVCVNAVCVSVGVSVCVNAVGVSVGVSLRVNASKHSHHNITLPTYMVLSLTSTLPCFPYTGTLHTLKDQLLRTFWATSANLSECY